MSTIDVGYKKIEKWVKNQVELGNDVRWDGWELVFFFTPPHATAQNDVSLVRKQDTWGYETRVSVDTDGKWRIPARSVKYI